MKPVNNYQPIDFKEPIQERSKKTREKILDAAKELFAENGFEETTTHLIASGAGISIGGVYAHFKNKEEIFLHVLERRSREIYNFTKGRVEEMMARDMSIDEGLEYYLREIYRAHTKYGKLNFEMNRFITMNDKAAAIHDHWEWEETKEIAKWLERRKEELDVEDPEVALIIASRAVHEVFHYLYKNRDRVDENRILKGLITMLKKFIKK
ncbi:MAG: TetR/AcrR family transcriptional regulator [Deltaproteobacteria bacterium]|uniref:TetR/AcrR family transcriptional regulator n=1 Tax=Candidatus Zymogenus saltonus TaxID=2844893 RepID=A0A9D8KE14_9DELT|nr:TetR/AcrR family transcriptional regulator [Candidatus Zymogenus saltonus]